MTVSEGVSDGKRRRIVVATRELRPRYIGGSTLGLQRHTELGESERRSTLVCVERALLTKSTERCAVADVATTAPTMRRREAMPCGCRWRRRTSKAEQA